MSQKSGNDRINAAPEGNGDRDDSGVDEPLVPVGVLRGIYDLAEGNTSSQDEIEDVLKF